MFLYFKGKIIQFDAYYTTSCQNIIIISSFFLGADAALVLVPRDPAAVD